MGTEHYVEVTAVIGPIGPPYKLHVFTADSEVDDTPHGELAQRVSEAILAVDRDASVCAHVVTAEDLGYTSPEEEPAGPLTYRFLRPACSTCSQSHQLARKFNGGDPIAFYQPACNCDDGDETS